MIQKSNAVVQVDRSLLQENLQTLSQFLDPDTQIMAVIKADAYGHGAVEVAKALEPHVAGFAVNSIREGIELREQDIMKPTLVFEVPQKELVSQYQIHNLIATISSKEHFEWLPRGTSYHLNFDTGMGRLGFHPSQAEAVADLVQEHGELKCTGIYSHFATADAPDSDLVKEQHDLFKKIRPYFPRDLTTHIANTGGTAFYDSQQFDMVRLGIGLYGYAPGETAIEGLQPVLSWDTHIAQVKRIEQAATVSYGAKWQAPEEGCLGILPVGYSDGVKRNLTGKISVRIDGKEYKAVGTITMNYSMVFLEDDYYEPGTKVELLYPESTAYDWAQHLNTIPYEILTSINPRIPRKYVG